MNNTGWSYSFLPESRHYYKQYIGVWSYFLVADLRPDTTIEKRVIHVYPNMVLFFVSTRETDRNTYKARRL